MKKRILVLLLLVIVFTTTSLHASPFSSYYPGGKNYLEENNFQRNQNTISSIDDIKIKSNTTYTLSFSGEGLLEFPEIILSTNNNSIYNGEAYDYPTCDVAMDFTECTFTTDSNDTSINLSITAEGLNTFINYYGFKDFQLEEGSSRTEYEEYIAPLIDANSPEFNGTGAYVTSYDNNYSIREIINSHIVVMDDIDGDITSQVEVISDTYTPNMNTVGEYTVELKASDAAGNSAYFTLTVIVKDETDPVINGPSSISVGFDTTMTLQTIINDNYSASDGHDGSLPLLIQSDGYTSSSHILGAYSVILKTTDASSNTTTKTITINVVDNSVPVLTSEPTITVYQSNPKTLTNILNGLIVYDDYDDPADITISVITENYSSASNSPGTYSALIELKDTSNNTKTYNLDITIVDDIYPEISGPTSFVFSYTEPKPLSEMINLQTVSDNTTSLTLANLVIVSDTYSTRNTKVGTFYITVEVKDAANNTTTKQIQVDVIDDQVPIIYVDNIMITLSENVTFNAQDALNLLIKNKELPDKEYNVSIINDEYTGNEDIPGKYNYSLRFDDDEGNSLQKDFIIEVPDEPSLLEDELFIRNVAIYSISTVIILFAIFKRKK